MASPAYYEWLRAGRPYTLIRPAKAVQTTLRRYGLTVYDYPDDSHQKANTPQDHTPYSATGYPGTNARWKARGLDVMPRGDSAAARKENADIARQIIRDRDAGHPGTTWIKYLNWTDEKGVTRQERWTTPGQPNRRTTVSSNDDGHIHISGRSDVDNDAKADGYDPIARMRAGLSGGDDDMDQKEAWLGRTLFVPEEGYEAPWLGGTVSDMLTYTRQDAHYARYAALRAAEGVTALTAVIEQLGAIIAAGGGNVDTGAILAGVDERLAKLAAAQRDAVADLGEGGAAQVRGPQE